MRFRHKKRGTEYNIVDIVELTDFTVEGNFIQYGALFAEIQSSRRVSPPGFYVIYEGHDKTLWARYTSEFFDGRFERI